MRKVYLLDFEDSFTFNIASVVSAMGFDVSVIAFEEILTFFSVLNPHGPVVIILGPGPGHPLEYEFLFPHIRQFLSHPLIFHFGICLGHQILGLLEGYLVEPCVLPVHGRSLDFTIPPWPSIFSKEDWGRKVKVQWYNSLCVIGKGGPVDDMIAGNNGECQARRFPRGISFQFHPESVGTDCPQIFFKSLFFFFKNHRDSCCTPVAD